MRARLIDSAGRAVVLARRATELFPVRVWRRFLRRNGFLLSAGMAYQALFALFALVYVAVAAVGIWLGGSESALDALIAVANSYMPGIIGEEGIATAGDVLDIAQSATSAFTITGLIAGVVVLWTAVGAVTFARRAVRDIFGLAFDSRSYVLLKLTDAAAALAFGIALLVGAAISVGGVWTLTQLLDLFGLHIVGALYDVLVRGSSVIVVIAIDTAAIALLVRFLTGTSIPWRTIWPGSVVGGAAVAVLQLGAGLLFAHTPGNPLLTTFAVMVALLLWCRAVAVVILLAASWIAQSARDRDEPLERPDAAQARRARLTQRERDARRRLDEAEVALASARWWRRRRARAEREAAQADWDEASAALRAAEAGTKRSVLAFLDGLAPSRSGVDGPH